MAGYSDVRMLAKLTHLVRCVTVEFKDNGAAAGLADAVLKRWAYQDGQF